MLALALKQARDRIVVLTVDHALRAGSAEDAAHVAAICARRAVSCEILTLDWPGGVPAANRQARAREARYAALGAAARAAGAPYLLTAHHAEDQAETMLMRLARGSGLSGLSGIRETRELAFGVTLLRPCLRLSSACLHAAAKAADMDVRYDPSNADGRHDRTRFRALLADSADLDPVRIAESAGHLAEARAALEWAADLAFASRAAHAGESIRIDPHGLPAELKRRLVLRAFAALDASAPRGPELMRFMEMLESGSKATLSGLIGEPGSQWTFSPERQRQS